MIKWQRKEGRSLQFYDFFKSLLDYIPQELSGVHAFFISLLPYILMVCSLFTAFFGLKCAKWWCALTFFFLGASVSSQLLLPSVDLDDMRFWIMLGVSISVGIICGYFSKYLYRAQLVISMFTLVYAALPSFILFFGDAVSKAVSLLVGLALAFLSVKYKYIIAIATTSFSGSFIFWGVIEDTFSVPYKTLFAVLTGIAALAFQCYMNRETLKNTYKDVKEKYKKTEKEGKKAVKFIKEKTHKAESESKNGSSAETESVQTASKSQNENEAETVNVG